MKKFLFAAVVLALTASDSFACGWLFGCRTRCRPVTYCQPRTVYYSQPAVQPVYYSQPQCSNGQCGQPIRTAIYTITQPCVNGRCPQK